MAERGRPAKNTAPVYNWAVEGLTRYEKTVGFKVGNLELVAKYSEYGPAIRGTDAARKREAAHELGEDE